MAPTYTLNAISFIAIILAALGIHVGNDALQTTVTTLLAIAVPAFTMIRQWYTGRSTIFGTRPK